MLYLNSIHERDPDPEQYYFVIMPDNSMSGFRICVGDFLVVFVQDALPPDCIAYVAVGNQDAVIRRVLTSDNCVIIQTSTPEIPSAIYQNEKVTEVRIIGLVIQSQIEFVNMDKEPEPPALPVVRLRRGRPPKLKVAEIPTEESSDE